ncbi:MAG: hypothetical protein HQ514_02010 [Rhodospirillales bacterium]|nr:hypothetical protein [Rhodospirillales bacterium]
MTELSYDAAPIPIREDLAAAHKRVWRHISEPGTWLNGATRVAIARETRNAPGCALCKRRKEALSPYRMDGTHDDRGILPPETVEIVHRIVTDPARLKRDWYEAMIKAGFGEGEYVETVSVICMIISIDTFNRAAGLEPPPLPEPVAGDPTRIRPQEAKPGAAWVPWIAPEDAAAFADEVFAATSSNVQRSLSLVPDACRSFFDLVEAQYLAGHEMRDFDNEFRAISHAQIEFIAGRVSALNQCVY